MNVSLSEQLDQLESDALRLGVRLVLGITPSGDIDLLHIARTGGTAGTGRTVMTQLCDVADRAGVAIFTYAADADPRLIAFYANFTFELDPDEGDEAQLRRLPQPCYPTTASPDDIEALVRQIHANLSEFENDDGLLALDHGRISPRQCRPTTRAYDHLRLRWPPMCPRADRLGPGRLRPLQRK